MKKYILLLTVLFSSSLFAKIFTFDCSYPTVSINGEIKANQKFLLKFIYDTDKNEAYLSGNNGTSKVASIKNDSGGVSFLEVIPSGNISLTTIDFNSLASVHSRHVIIGKTFLPQQFYGSCTLK